ncbi:DUF262 domain-containing protein [Streptomyces liangshanensis]|uniref:DUF262 domain-containing protein n=1 Tax=Streptomyces liangshanensis TaxID=2717324 RepID=A0A6G9H1K4_9ACTN|nr:DUF262 domain-containing protein [Streptomyces liangshanensis]QIQ04422.1 DUF262 domain-containing protein [Streptomyces liangshanensis]
MNTSPAGLEAQPTAITYELGDLVPLAWGGRIRVPHFQRDFRWQSQDVMRLFDSIVKGYPIGNLLLWVRRQQAEEFMLGKLRLIAPPHDESLWVVDGQQRLISLANALSAEGHQYKPFTVYYDLAEKEFVENPKIPEPYHVALPTLFDLKKLLTWFRTDGLAASEYFDEAERVATALRQYKVPAYLVRQDDRDVLTDIFDRMNNYGRRLNRAEIFSALYSGEEKGANERLTLTRISDNVAARTGFGSIDTGTVLASVLARRGSDPMRDIRLEFSSSGRRTQPEFPDEDQLTAYSQGEEALVRAVRFLIQEAGMPHISLLPYRALLVTLTRFFAHFPQPKPNNIRLLRRLFWRLSLVGPMVFKGSFTLFSRTLGSKIRPGDEEGSLRSMLDTISEAHPVLPSADRFRTNEATTKIILSAWWSLHPRSLTTGEILDAQSLDALLEQDRTAANAAPMVFPRLKDSRTKLLPANRLFLPSGADPVSEIPGALAYQPLDIDDETWNAVLASHLLDRDIAALADTNREEFLNLRQRRILQQLEDFLKRMAEWEYEDTPSLDTLDLDGEFQEFQEGDLPAAPDMD